MKFFNECKTQDEIKATFKKLAMLNHPDRGGSEAIMKEINNEYSFAIAKVLSSGGFTESEVNESILQSEAYKDALSQIVSLDGIIIELVGAWIWVTGDTKPVKEILRAAGFYWASKKEAWYFRGSAFIAKNYGKTFDLNTIKAKYGSQHIAGKKRSYIN